MGGFGPGTAVIRMNEKETSKHATKKTRRKRKQVS
jgi:hypothetical protein